MVANVDVFMKKLVLSIGAWQFSPGLRSSLITLLLFPLFVYLGFWQWGRYEGKKIQQQELESRINEPVLLLTPSPALRAPSPASGRGEEEFNKNNIQYIRYRQLQVTGHFLNEKTLLLDNQILSGKVGYRVITPFQATDSQQLLLIDRGWIPLGQSRNELPIIHPVLGKKTLIGTLHQPVSGLLLKDIPLPQNTWPLRIQRINFDELSKHYGQSLFPFLLQLHENDPNGFASLPLTPALPPIKHLAYAIQWLALALGLLIYYLAINARRIR